MINICDQQLEKYKERCLAFWNKDYIDRCSVSIIAPKEPGLEINRYEYENSISPNGINLEKYWLDAEHIINTHIKRFENTFFGGEAIPNLFVDLGPGIISAYLGCETELKQDTVWFHPNIKDWDKDEYTFNEDSFMWKKTVEITKLASERSAGGKFFVSITDVSGVADIMSNMRGAQDLIFDMIDSPQSVIKARDYILKQWFMCVNKLYEIAKSNNGGCMNRHSILAPSAYYPLQCDFSANISPAMFEEFFIPEIREQCKKMEYSEYHLDGMDALKHVDLLLDIPELDAIQWQQGVNGGPMTNWIPLIDKIQKAGKSVVLGVKPNDVETLLKGLSHKGLFLCTQCKDKDEAQDLLRLVESYK